MSDFDVGFSGIYRIVVRYFGKNITMIIFKNVYVDCIGKSYYVSPSIIIKLNNRYYKDLQFSKEKLFLMKDHNIPITNRKCSKELDNGNYNVISVIADIIMILLILLQ